MGKTKKELFNQSGYTCTWEEYEQFDCSTCPKEDCPHRFCYRRVPLQDGGLSLCPRLQAFYEKQKKG